MKTALAFLSLWTAGLGLAAQPDKRADDTSLTALQTLVENQASTIQQLQAELSALNTKVQQQASQISSHSSHIYALQNAQRKEVGFLADMSYHQPSDITIPVGGIVKFNFIISNTGRAYNNITGIFTAPYTGLYAFFLHFKGGLDNRYTTLTIYNGLSAHASAYSDGDRLDDNDQGSTFAVLHLTQGNQVAVKVSGGSGRIYGSGFTSFAGALLHAD